MNTDTSIPRSKTREVMVGSVAVGGGAPIAVQSMCSTKTSDVDATLEQINSLYEAGCEIIRVTVPTLSDVEAFSRICSLSPMPVVADIHFDHRIASAAAQNGAAAIRINPGNIGSMAQVDEVIDTCKQTKTPIRIGVNAGSLDSQFDEKSELSLCDKLVGSAISFVDHFERRGFSDIVLSAKAHDVVTTLQTYRTLSRELPSIPLHVGVTEAGTLRQGTVKNSVGVGILLEEGIGDTIRLSLTADPEEEIYVAFDLLSALGLRRRFPEIVSCPTCGRTEVDLIAIANEVQSRLAEVKEPISVAVMGCVVNGPGEAKDADIGVACGRGRGVIFSRGTILRTVDESEITDALMEEIKKLYS